MTAYASLDARVDGDLLTPDPGDGLLVEPGEARPC
jgi:hypothetical protein